MHFEAAKIAFGQDRNGLILKLSIHPDQVPKDVMLAPLGTRYMVVMVQLGDDDKPVQGKDKTEGQKAIASAGMLVQNERFTKWMHQKGYTENDSVAAATKGIREICGVVSRSEFATNETARNAFTELRSEFHADFKKGLIK